MKFITAVGTAILGATLLSGQAFSANALTMAPPANRGDALIPNIAKEFDKSLPPVGYVQFCARGEQECQFKGGKIERLAMTAEKMDQLNQVNTYVNTKIRPIGDSEQFGVPDYWTYPVVAGDCEDFQLLKKRYLVGLGFSPDELLMTVVFDENGDGHAVLTVLADTGDYVLDNRRDEILLWHETGYKFLKRQSQLDPKQWVSLQKTTPQIVVSTQGN